MHTSDQTDIKHLIYTNPYNSYIYSYPHKTAYRELNPPIELKELWEKERKDSLFLYIHIPFCLSRCGYCNLFSLSTASGELHDSYIKALERQAYETASILGSKSFTRFAIGGGTPTLLSEYDIERLFDIADKYMGIDFDSVPISVETSPETAEAAKLKLLKERKVDRISIGVQSFMEQEACAIYRGQNTEGVLRALERIREYEFPVLNIDLIYGIPGQTPDSWIYSLESALKYMPEEIYIYPLYVRPQTKLRFSGIPTSSEERRMEFYKIACDVLESNGYKQLSMRNFRRKNTGSIKECPEYSCQDDGMVGLGCGARSYTQTVHYSWEYGVADNTTRKIIERYIASESFQYAHYGFVLDISEQKRRYLLKSLLHVQGVGIKSYSDRFGAELFEDFPQLKALASLGLAYVAGDSLKLNQEGLGYSDAIGPWLISEDVKKRMEGYSYL
ncbi:MAG: STM4012 family radical SAM protein [Clostridia bacterium]|nr:STM4012 family radical SAM protein [Clostridia bacterium]